MNSMAFIMAALLPLSLMQDSASAPSFKTLTYTENNGQVTHNRKECYLTPDTTLHFTFKTQWAVTIKGHDQDSIIIDEKIVQDTKEVLGRNLDEISFSLTDGSHGQCAITPVDKIGYNYREYIIYVPRSARIICKPDDYVKIMDMKNSVYVEGNFIALENLTGPETTVVNLGRYNHNLFLKNITGLLKFYSTTPSSLPYDAQTCAHLQMYPLSERPEKPTN